MSPTKIGHNIGLFPAYHLENSNSKDHTHTHTHTHIYIYKVCIFFGGYTNSIVDDLFQIHVRRNLISINKI